MCLLDRRRDVALLRLYKGFGQHIIKFWRYLLSRKSDRSRFPPHPQSQHTQQQQPHQPS